MATALKTPTSEDVVKANRQISPHLRPTPLLRHLALDRLTGAETWVKHENHNPTGAFKVRGGVNLVSRLEAEERKRGVISASTGNHGQSVAYAARLFDISAVICAPAVANPLKVQAMRDLGAEVVLQGAKNETVAEGLASGVPFELPQRLLWDLLDDFVLVSDEELLEATAAMITGTRNLVEPAGAAALAGAIKLRDRLQGRKLALICSGGNISPAHLKQVVDRLG